MRKRGPASPGAVFATPSCPPTPAAYQHHQGMDIDFPVPRRRSGAGYCFEGHGEEMGAAWFRAEVGGHVGKAPEGIRWTRLEVGRSRRIRATPSRSHCQICFVSTGDFHGCASDTSRKLPSNTEEDGRPGPAPQVGSRCSRAGFRFEGRGEKVDTACFETWTNAKADSATLANAFERWSDICMDAIIVGEEEEGRGGKEAEEAEAGKRKRKQKRERNKKEEKEAKRKKKKENERKSRTKVERKEERKGKRK